MLLSRIRQIDIFCPIRDGCKLGPKALQGPKIGMITVNITYTIPVDAGLFFKSFFYIALVYLKTIIM